MIISVVTTSSYAIISHAVLIIFTSTAKKPFAKTIKYVRIYVKAKRLPIKKGFISKLKSTTKVYSIHAKGYF